MTVSGLASILLLIFATSTAQNDVGTIAGKVTDPDGKNVQGVVVQAKHVPAEDCSRRRVCVTVTSPFRASPLVLTKSSFP
jgi:hypothetical protein